jgi:hypothetical protein
MPAKGAGNKTGSNVILFNSARTEDSMRVASFLASVLMTCGLASASTVYVLNADNGAEAPANDTAPFLSGLSEQYLLAGSQFSSVPVGSQITGIGLRLDGGQSTITTAITATSFTVKLSTSLTAIGSMSGTLANNIGPDVTTVISGPLDIPGGSFVGGAGPNPFYFLTFSTPYTYQGGDLLVTVLLGSVTGSATVDANVHGSLEDSSDPGLPNFYNVPVLAFTYSAGSSVPEPSTALLAVAGVCLLAICKLRLR